MNFKFILVIAFLLGETSSFAIGKAPLTTGLRCSTNVLLADGSESTATLDVFGANPDRQISSLKINHGGTNLNLVGSGKLSFPSYVMANQVSNIHQTKIFFVDPKMPDANGKKSANINVKLKFKVKYQRDAQSGKVIYSGSILYSFPDGKGDTMDASGAIVCTCTNGSGAPQECVSSEKEDKKLNEKE